MGWRVLEDSLFLTLARLSAQTGVCLVESLIQKFDMQGVVILSMGVILGLGAGVGPTLSEIDLSRSYKGLVAQSFPLLMLLFPA